MHFQIGARIRQQREAGGVRLRKSVQRKRRDGRNNLLGHLAGDALLRHPVAQLHFHLLHPPLRSLEAERAAQFLRLAAAETGGDHGHAQQLLLEQRHAQRARENRLERRVRVGHRLAPGTAVQKRMHHLSHDRPRPDDRHLHHDVVKLLRPESGQARHLRAAFNLKHANRVCLLHHLESGSVIIWNVRKIKRAPALTAQLKCILHHRHHPEPE